MKSKTYEAIGRVVVAVLRMVLGVFIGWCIAQTILFYACWKYIPDQKIYVHRSGVGWFDAP